MFLLSHCLFSKGHRDVLNGSDERSVSLPVRSDFRLRMCALPVRHWLNVLFVEFTEGGTRAIAYATLILTPSLHYRRANNALRVAFLYYMWFFVNSGFGVLNFRIAYTLFIHTMRCIEFFYDLTSVTAGIVESETRWVKVYLLQWD